MNKLDFMSQIEEELSWRVVELKFFTNQLSIIEKEKDREKYRKSLIVMLYSYYEGFCKAAFKLYIDMINSKELMREEANLFIKTASFESVFASYSNSSKKDERFKKHLPDDTKLHRYSRQVTFVNEFTQFLTEKVELPEEIVDTESNLKPIVLKKILYRLGFEIDELKISENTINSLIAHRNSISHGSMQKGVTEQQYTKLENEVLDLMTKISKMIQDATVEELYLK